MLPHAMWCNLVEVDVIQDLLRYHFTSLGLVLIIGLSASLSFRKVCVMCLQSVVVFS